MIEFLLRIWRLARPYRGRLMLGVLTGIIGGLIEPLMIATIAFVYGVVFPSGEGQSMTEQLRVAPAFIQQWAATLQESLSSGAKANPWAVVGLVAAIPVIVALRGLFGYLNVYFLQWTAVRTITDLRTRLFGHIMRLSAGFFSGTSTGQLMSRINNDTSALQGVISLSVGVMVKDPVTVLALLAYLMWQQPKLTIISMIIMPACMVPIAIYARKIRQSTRAMQANAAQLSSMMAESFSGNRVVKAYNLEEAVTEQFRTTAGRFISHYMRIVRSSEIPGPVLETVGSLGVALVLVYLAFETGNRPSSAEFLALVLSLFAMYRPMKNLTRLHNSLQQARAASERVFELLAVQNSIVEPANPKPLRAADAEIVFDHVDFSYGNKAILRDIHLVVKPGQLVALVGPSGSGKTTITNLLLRFFDPERGSIRIGGTDIREVSSADLRNQIAVVTQETILFNETIHRNIELGRPGASPAEVAEAARLAHATEFIKDKPEGFETVVGEKGVTLSGGQRQRIAIARAIVKNAPILILDEATNALDTESERAVQAALEELMQNKTTICVAHRLSTIQKADLIAVMENGRIVETGTHNELLQARGLYSKLYELQYETASEPA
jgi:ATP-binding cassette, subfamily B, bacterial MsbA